MWDYPITFWIGIIVNTAAAAFGALGDSLVRKAHLTQTQTGSKIHFLKNPTWWAGIICTSVFNILFTFLALYYIPLSLVTSFAGLHILFVVLISKIWLKEGLTFSESIGSALEILGIVVLVQSSSTRDFDNLLVVKGFFFETKSYVFIIANGFIIVMALLFQYKKFHKFKYIRWISEISLPIACGFMGGFTNMFSKAISIGFNELSNRAFIIEETIFFVIMSICAISSLLFQAHLWNLSLKKGLAGFVASIINSSLIVSGALVSTLVYCEYPRNYSLFVLGIIIIISGLIFLFIGKNDDNTKEYENDEYQVLQKLVNETKDYELPYRHN